MKINEIIRQRRLALNLTQEQVAARLGVTAPAVNKWEKGISYPDITLLPPLARLLGTDLNTLLSFKEALTPQEITLFANELARIIQTQGFMAAYETAMEKIKEYPDCHALILTAATMLDGAAMLDPDSPKTRRPYEKDIEALYVRALESTDPSVQNRARSMLIQKFMQRQEYDQAQELIAALPDDTAVDKKQLQANLYIARGQLEDAARMEEEKLLSAVNEIQTILLTLMEIALKENRKDDAQSLADISGNCARLFNLWEYNTYIAHFQLYITQKDRLRCLKTLGTMLKSLTHPWDPTRSPLYRHIKTKTVEPGFGDTLKKNILTALKNDEAAAFLKEPSENDPQM